jgi:lysyl-tRNA synthetase class 2
VRHAVTDPRLHSVSAQWPGGDSAFLHTSPEYAMKRLLAAGSGDIYQICHVFRGAEQGPLHNGEFTLIEWYRVSWSMPQLMDEVAALVQALLSPAGPLPVRSLSYADALRQYASCDPLGATDDELATAARAQGFDAALLARCTRDELLDLLMGARVGPKLGHGELCFVHRYPASQAALARLDPEDPRLALRFELYAEGIELANGFEELGDAGEQRGRFEAERRERIRCGLPPHEPDERLLAALLHGMPPCAGVAVGFDRVLMLAAGVRQIADVLPFTSERA